jgi:pimeloyl-ACP methyl ester carboxylesterase
LSCLVGLVALSFVLFNLDKILYWEDTIDIGDSRISFRDWGKGEPIVIIEGGIDQPKHKYFLLSFFTSSITRTIAYDHAGVGNSSKSPNPRLLPHYVKELRKLMKKKNVHPPFILVGHSSGGHTIRYYTHLYPEEVAGLVFIDMPHEDWLNYIRENWSQEEIKKYLLFWYPLNPKKRKPEKLHYEMNCSLVRGLKLPIHIPVLMFTGNNKLHFRKHEAGIKEDMRSWAESQFSLIKHIDNAEQIVDWETGHYPFKDKPVMVISKINKFVKKIQEDIERNSPQ